MREPPVKKTLYWCDSCGVPLIGRTCACGAEGRAIPLLQPYDVRPALTADMVLLAELLEERFGTAPLPTIVLLNKAGGIDRNDLVIAHGERFGWISFDPVTRAYRFDAAAGALPSLVGAAARGIVDLDAAALPGELGRGRLGGKKIRVSTGEHDGTVIVRYRGRYGTGSLREGAVRVKELASVTPRSAPNPDWACAVRQNRYHLKNLERNAIREIRSHMHDRPCANVSFSGGKDSTAVLTLARKAGIDRAFFIDTGIEFPETLEYVRKTGGVEVVEKGGDFWAAAEKAGPPAKDHRWCCKLLKLYPLKRFLATVGPCITVQGNRWYESWNRASLEATSQNPENPLQLNLSPIRNWRALEVYLYLWWQEVDLNPLYDRGIERIGCYVCPSMLESEYELLRGLHPDVARRWDEVLERYRTKHGLPEEYRKWGLWRWKDLPPKMEELVRTHRVSIEGSALPRPAETVQPAEKTAMTTEEIRKDFPMLGDLIYLDNAAMSLAPEPVLAAMLEYEHHYRANVGRGVHRIAQIATQRYWHAHEKVARFIGGGRGTTVFSKNSTEAINMVASGLPWQPGDRVVTTVLEHHSNLLPWQRLRRRGVECVIAGITPEYTLDLAALEAAVDERTRLVAVTHASNALGTIVPIGEVARICRESGALLLVDGAQTVPHMPVNVEELGCDFFCFSGQKMLGPTGTGVLWMKDTSIEPGLVGGGIVESVTEDGYALVEGYARYEAGTPHIAGGIGLGAAVEYLERVGMDAVRSHDRLLATRLIDGLGRIPGVRVYAPWDPDRRIGVVSFTIDGFDPHEVAHFLDEEADILVRSGHHCCMPLMHRLGLEKGTVRASLHLYSTEYEIDTLIATVDAIARGA